jgi:hypothetical protein
MRSSWETVSAKLNSNSNPTSTYAKTNGKQVNFKDNNFNNNEHIALVQEQAEKILKEKFQVHNTESAPIEDKELT